jgi:GATA-binding protein 2
MGFNKLFVYLFKVQRPISMKKDGIQTRNRKISAKSKKKRNGDFTSMEFFKSPLDKSFSHFPPPNFNPTMHHPSMTSYMNVNTANNFGSSFGAGAHAPGSTADLSCRLGSGYGPITSNSFGTHSSFGHHSFPSSFYGGSATGGLDLSTNAGIVGAMA